MIHRLIAQRLSSSRKSVLLLGARQVGKSTLVRGLRPDMLVDLADEGAFLGFAKDPARLGREVRALRRPSLIALDEVQRIPSLLNTVQALVDERKGHRFLLCGSSARKLKRGGANLLPGRVVLEHLDPLTIWELGDAFDLDRALRLGTLPGIYLDREDPEDSLESYATVYLREEIQAEALVREVGSYARFLDAAAEASGEWINYSKLASDTEIPKETLRRFYQILEDTLVAFRVAPFQPRSQRRRVSQRDRFIFFDLGVRNALLGGHRRKCSANEQGRLFEQWLILQCMYFIHAHRLPWHVLSYRSEAGAEVDAVVDTGDRFLALECKMGRGVTSSELSGLRSFQSIADKKVESFLLFGGERAQVLSDGIEAVPYREFLLERLPELARA